MSSVEKKRRGRPPKKKESDSSTDLIPANPTKRAKMSPSSADSTSQLDTDAELLVKMTLRRRDHPNMIVLGLLSKRRVNATQGANPLSPPDKKRKQRPPKNPAARCIVENTCPVIIHSPPVIKKRRGRPPKNIKRINVVRPKIDEELKEIGATITQSAPPPSPCPAYLLLKNGRDTEQAQVSLEKEIASMEIQSKNGWKEQAEAIANSAADPSNELEFIVGNVQFFHCPQQNATKIATLAKFNGFPRAVWIRPGLQDDLLKEFCVRNQWENELAIFLRAEFSGRDAFFKTNFGKRYLAKPRLGVYPEVNTVAHHRTLIRAREHDFNTVLSSVGLPPLYILDWSGQKLHRTNYQKNSLFEFEYTSYLEPSRRVQKVLDKKHYPMMDQCNSTCECSTHSKISEGRKACSCNKDKSWKQSDMECGDHCTCPITCANRTVQRGRQMPLIMMRHSLKGWTIRAFRDIKKGEYIGEYTGEVLTYAEHLKLANNTYSIDFPCCFADKKKKDNSRMKEDPARKREKWMKGYCHRHFVITAKRKGNEGRTFSHSCDPNMEMRMTYIERCGYGYHHIAFWANQDIPRFGELTWNYFGEALEEAQRKNETYSCSILPKCCCGSSKCVIVPCDDDDEDVKEDSDDSCSDYSDDEDRMPRRASSNGENTTPTRL